MQLETPFKPLVVDDLLPLPEQEVPVELGMMCFLDQDIPSHPKGGYVKILAESLLVGQQTGISAYHWKTELGCSN